MGLRVELKKQQGRKRQLLLKSSSGHDGSCTQRERQEGGDLNYTHPSTELKIKEITE
jgi:hypothetical protein